MALRLQAGSETVPKPVGRLTLGGPRHSAKGSGPRRPAATGSFQMVDALPQCHVVQRDRVFWADAGLSDAADAVFNSE
jgi:hypothetical protein